MVANVPIVLWAVDATGNITMAEGNGFAALDIQPADLIGRNVFDAAAHLHSVVSQLHRALGGETVEAVFEVNERSFQARFIPVRGEDGSVMTVVGIAMDVSERQQTLEALRRQAISDPLTGLSNRALFYDRLEHALLETRRTGKPVALLTVDLNGFKEINDTFGHHQGDEVLRIVAARLQAATRATDTIARLGGDEFAVILSMADSRGAERVVQSIHRALDEPIVVGDYRFPVTASIGIALSDLEQPIDGRLLLQRADGAMYVAKHSGRRFAFYRPEQELRTSRRLALIADLRQVLAEDHLLVHYQPLMDLRTGRVEEVEALVRWQHPVQGLLPPDRFIPLAEDTGLITALTDRVLHAVLRQWRRWQRDGVDLRIAVNLSARALPNRGLFRAISRLARHEGVHLGALTLELTESTVMADPHRITQLLAPLRNCGVRVALDDFGAGYSSLAHLKRLPLDEIKIDRSFVADMVANAEDATIVRAIINLGHDLGLEVVAEGVEDTATWEMLVQAGCDRIQGFYLSPPLSGDDLHSWYLDEVS